MMDKRTFARLHIEGKKVRNGDRESGIWVCPKTAFYGTGAEKSAYLREGSRIAATWEFTDGDWRMVASDMSTILPPATKPARWEDAWRAARLTFIVAAAVAAVLLLVWGR